MDLLQSKVHFDRARLHLLKAVEQFQRGQVPRRVFQLLTYRTPLSIISYRSRRRCRRCRLSSSWALSRPVGVGGKLLGYNSSVPGERGFDCIKLYEEMCYARRDD